jgi:hypothetical protein
VIVIGHLVAEVSGRREELTRSVAAVPAGRCSELVETVGALSDAAGEQREDDRWLAWQDDIDDADETDKTNAAST